MGSPPLTGRRRLQAVLLLLVTTLVVTGGCVGLLNEDDGNEELSTETPDTDQADRSASDTDEQGETESAASAETQSSNAEEVSTSEEEADEDTDRPEENSEDTTAAARSASTAEPLLSYVPASADAIVTVDPGVLTHESTIALANGSESTDEWNYSDLDADHTLFDSAAETADVSSYRETIDLYEQQLGINVSEVHSVTVFTEEGDQNRESGHHDAVAIFDTEVTWATIHDALTQSDRIDGEFVERSHNSVQLYQIPKNHSAYSGSHAEETWVAVFGNGVFAVGSREQVETVIDTHTGESAAVGGALREEAAAAEGLVTVVADMPDDQEENPDDTRAAPMPEVETTVVEYAPDGERVRLAVDFVTPDPNEARDLEGMLSFTLNSDGLIDDPEKAEIYAEISDRITVDKEDNRVQLEFEMDAERINELVERAEELEKGE